MAEATINGVPFTEQQKQDFADSLGLVRGIQNPVTGGIEKIMTGQVQAPPYALSSLLRTNIPSILDKAVAGVAAGPILVIGDSTSWGLFASGGPAKSWPKRLADMLAAQGIPALSCGYGAKASSSGGIVDSRITVGAGWLIAPYGPGGAAWNAPGGTTEPLTITVEGTVDHIRVYFIRNSGLGTITTTLNGSAIDTTSTAGAFGLDYKDVAFSQTANPTIMITPSVANLYVNYVEVWNSASPHVRILNAGVAGSTSADWAADGSTIGSISCIKKIAPAHTFIMLGRNDAAVSVSADQRATSIAEIVAAAQISGTVTLMSPVPADTALNQEPLIAQYVASDKTLGVSYIDVGAYFKDYATANSIGLMHDQIHEGQAGHGAVARLVLQHCQA